MKGSHSKASRTLVAQLPAPHLEFSLQLRPLMSNVLKFPPNPNISDTGVDRARNLYSNQGFMANTFVDPVQFL